MTKNLLTLSLVLALQAGLIAGCATVPQDPEERAVYKETNDPLEPTNRFIFGFNQFLDKYLITPATEAYRFVVPEYGRERVGSVLNNLGEPVNFVNDALQGRGSDAGDTVARFAMNSSFGVLGLFDVAKDLGVPERHGDFGQTLYTYGVGEGPYLVLPLFGPSNVRDAAGLGADLVIDPWGYVGQGDTVEALQWTRYGATVLDRRDATLDMTQKLEKESLDYYATMRSISRQYRAKQLQNQMDKSPVEASSMSFSK